MRFAGCEVKGTGPIFKTQTLIYRSKSNLDEKILFGKITDHLDPEIWKMVIREQGFHIPFWSMTFLLLKLKFYF